VRQALKREACGQKLRGCSADKRTEILDQTALAFRRRTAAPCLSQFESVSPVWSRILDPVSLDLVRCVFEKPAHHGHECGVPNYSPRAVTDSLDGIASILGGPFRDLCALVPNAHIDVI
jgi:hypothetical protein